MKYWIFFFGGQKIDENYITNRLYCFDTGMDYSSIDYRYRVSNTIQCYLRFLFHILICNSFAFAFLPTTTTVSLSCQEISISGKPPKPRDLGTASVLGNSAYIFAGSSGVPVNDLDRLTWKVKKKSKYNFPAWD